MKPTHPPDPVPAQAGMTLGNMRELGVRHVIAWRCRRDSRAFADGGEFR